LKLLLDEMFSPLVAAELRARGHDAVAIKERDEWQSLSDPDVAALARTEQRTVVTALPADQSRNRPGRRRARGAAGRVPRRRRSRHR
jgi:Domain of unknown function (DUF5615)